MKVNETKRTRRTPVSGKRNVLTVEGKDPNYVYRFVNDNGDRVAIMQEQGYEVVTDSSIKVGDRRVANPTQEGSPVKASVGQGQQAFLMRIKKEWYDEDQAAKQAHVTELETAMKKEAKEGMYGKIEISS